MDVLKYVYEGQTGAAGYTDICDTGIPCECRFETGMLHFKFSFPAYVPVKATKDNPNA